MTTYRVGLAKREGAVDGLGLDACGLTPDALVPETLALPWRDDGRWFAWITT